MIPLLCWVGVFVLFAALVLYLLDRKARKFIDEVSEYDRNEGPY